MKPFKLDDQSKIGSGFKTPDNYFENFQSVMIEKLSKEPIVNDSKVISIFRKRKAVLFAVAAVLTIALMIPILFQSSSSNKNIDTTALENYLTEESHLNQVEIINEIEPKSDDLILNTKEIEAQALEDMLASNPNIENLVIEN